MDGQDIIKIDGNYLEGGGQIVRTALAISCLTGKPFEVYDIRKGREQGGLKAQHLNCIRALEAICNARCEGADIGSTNIRFFPGKIAAKNFEIDIGTAGSVTLVLQSILLPLIFADKKSRITISGGTSAKWAMPYEYLANVFVPHMQRFADVEVKLLARGYYPKGGGKIEISVKPKVSISKTLDFQSFIADVRAKVKPIMLLTQGKLLQIRGVSHAAAALEGANVSERQKKACEITLKRHLSCPISIQPEYARTLSAGSEVVLWALFANEKGEIDHDNPVILGSDCLGERGIPAEKVGEDAANELLNELASKAPVDHHMEDNLIPYLAIAGGKIKVEQLTAHTKTNIYTIEKFLGKTFEIDEKERTIKKVEYNTQERKD